MSRKRYRAKHGPRSADAAQEKIVAGLPNELLLEVWDHLPPIERVAVSQVCSNWRRLSLSTPRLWSRVEFVSTMHSHPRSCSSCRSKTRNPRKWNIYTPRHGTTNAALFEQLLLRSTGSPLDVTVLLDSESYESQKACFHLISPHRKRLTRIHFANGESADLDRLVRRCGTLPALRTITAGFDDRSIEYFDLPLRSYQDTKLPVLNQVHLGAAVDCYSNFLRVDPLPSVQELTLTPVFADTVRKELHMCPNLSRLNLVMARFSGTGGPSHVSAAFRQLGGWVADFEKVCFLDIPAALDGYIQKSFNDARHRHLILNYQGRHRVVGSMSHLSLPSPCDALDDAVRLTLRLRENVYEIDVTDMPGCRREILLDASTVRRTPGLWDCYVSKKTIVSATVDALAWDYFAAGLQDACEIPDLTLVVARAAAELETVSLARFVAVRKLRVECLRAGLRLNAAVVRRLATSPENKEKKIDVLSIGATVQVEDALTMLPELASSVVHE